MGIWRYDDNNGGAGTWHQYSGLNLTGGFRVATVTTTSEQGVVVCRGRDLEVFLVGRPTTP